MANPFVFVMCQKMCHFFFGIIFRKQI
jgi:hypothetical protein